MLTLYFLICIYIIGLAFGCMSFCSKLALSIGFDEGLVPKSRLPATKMVDYMIQELEDLKILMSSKFEESNTALLV